MVWVRETDKLMQESKEALISGNLLIIASEDAVVGAETEKEKLKSDTTKDVKGMLVKEYRAIKKAFSEVVDREKIVIIEDKNIPALNPHYQLWPRNAHVIINGQIYIVPDAWNVQDARVIKTEFGNGGAVLPRGNTVIAANVAVYDIEEDIRQLKKRGMRVGIIPPVDPLQQKYQFAYDDIDCHIALVEDRGGRLELLVARSYFDQDISSSAEIKKAAEEIKSRLTIIEDADLPPFSFNLVQFDDLSVVMTSGALILEERIAELIGKGKMHTTGIPIVEIPKRRKGGIGCMTNIAPNFLIEGKPSA